MRKYLLSLLALLLPLMASAYAAKIDDMKRYLILAVLAWAGLSAEAANVNEQEARRRAVEFIGERGATRTDAARLERVYLPLETTAAQWSATDAPLYAFNANGGGYIIVSGDDRAARVLGFSTKGSLDAERLPVNMRHWLQGYASKIERLQQGRASLRRSATRAASAKSSIAPKMKTTWGQDYPYNLHTPSLRLKWEGRDTTIHAATGCVATALAQVMNYYRYPAQTLDDIESYEGTAEVPVYSYRKGKVDTLLVDYKTTAVAKGTKIDWANMADSYDTYDEQGNLTSLYGNTSEEKEAVARLMQYCGSASSMEYGLESASYASSMVDALYKVFGYKGCYQLLQEDYDDQQDWEDAIYNELAKAGPVLFSGATLTQGGHQFLLDGYERRDDGNYFYVNWGWDGYFDGYMLLDVLDPGWIYNEDDETEGFNTYQSGIGGMGPNGVAATACEMPMLAVFSFSVGNPDKTYQRQSKNEPFAIDAFDMTFVNQYRAYAKTVVAVALYDADGQLKSYTHLSDPDQGLEFFLYYGYQIDSTMGFDLQLGEKLFDGKYYVVPCTSGVGDNDFEPMQYATAYPVVMTIKGNKATFSEGSHTAINNIVTDDDDHDSNDWYSLSGQRLGGKPSKKGIYVRNGRKVMVR